MTWFENRAKEVRKETEHENIMQYMRLMGVVK